MTTENSAAQIAPGAVEFDRRVEDLLREYADRMGDKEAYQASYLMMDRALRGVVSYLRQGRSDDEIRGIMSRVVDAELARRRAALDAALVEHELLDR